MGRSISDAEMQSLEAQHQGPAKKRSLSDDEMSQMEAKGPSPASAPQDKVGAGLENWLRGKIGDTSTDLLKGFASAHAAYGAGLAQGGTLGNFKATELPGAREAVAEHPVIAKASEIAGGIGTGGAVGAGAASLLPKGAGLLPSAARVGGNIAAAGAQGLARSPNEGETRGQNAIDTMKSPWTYAPVVAGELAAPIARGMANRSMKRAVGITGAASKRAPQDVGNQLVEEGIWGTRKGMADQVDDKFQSVERDLQGMAKDLPDSVPGEDLAAGVEARLARHLDPMTGKSLPGHEADVAKIKNRADQLRYGKAVAPEDVGPHEPVQYNAQSLLAHKRGGDWEGYTHSSTPATTTDAEIGRAQANAARASLGKMSGQIPEALKREQALLVANKSLKVPEMTSKSPLTLNDLVVGNIGATTGGIPGAAGGALASKAAMLPLSQSLFAHGAQGMSKAMTNAELIQALMGAKESFK